MSVEFGPVHSLPPEELEPASLLDTTLRVWAEVGRARMPAASVVGMSEGAILDLDVESHEPADLFVNGRHFGTGRLILVDGEWALRVETLDDQGGDDGDGDAEPEADAAQAVEHVSSPDQSDPASAD
jgi:flagellar motor switch protein FliM